MFISLQNCPHGRPTMRHLINTAMLINEDEEDEANEKPIAGQYDNESLPL